MWRKLLSLTALALFLPMPRCVCGQGDDKHLEAVQEYLKKAHAKKKWQSGPKLLTSATILKAYGGEQKFYYVFSAPPLPPGANLPELIRAYQARHKDYLENYVSATVRLDAARKVIPLIKPGDYSEGLMPVKNAEDVKIAAAAVLSLYGSNRVAPGLVTEKEVMVTATEQGWRGVVNRNNAFQGTVEFDKKGQATKLSKVFTGPVPP